MTRRQAARPLTRASARAKRLARTRAERSLGAGTAGLTRTAWTPRLGRRLPTRTAGLGSGGLLRGSRGLRGLLRVRVARAPEQPRAQ